MNAEHNKPRLPRHAYYDIYEVKDWLKAQGRNDALAYVEHCMKGRGNGVLAGWDAEQNAEDMREFPKSYEGCGYTVETLEWLTAQFGTPRPSVYHWW